VRLPPTLIVLGARRDEAGLRGRLQERDRAGDVDGAGAHRHLRDAVGIGAAVDRYGPCGKRPRAHAMVDAAAFVGRFIVMAPLTVSVLAPEIVIPFATGRVVHGDTRRRRRRVHRDDVAGKAAAHLTDRLHFHGLHHP